MILIQWGREEADAFEMGNLKIQGGDREGRNNTRRHEYLKPSYLKFKSEEIPPPSLHRCQPGARGEAVISAGGWRGLSSARTSTRVFPLNF